MSTAPSPWQGHSYLVLSLVFMGDDPTLQSRDLDWVYSRHHPSMIHYMTQTEFERRGRGEQTVYTIVAVLLTQDAPPQEPPQYEAVSAGRHHIAVNGAAWIDGPPGFGDNDATRLTPAQKQVVAQELQLYAAVRWTNSPLVQQQLEVR